MIEIKRIVICAIVATLILYAWVFVTEQTFGQRAAQKYQRGSEEWKAEVQRLITVRVDN